MNWIGILGIVVIAVAIATLFKARPPGGRPAARTRLMTVARAVALVIGLILIVAALVYRTG